MRLFRAILYGLMTLVLAGGWAFLYWRSSAVDLAAGNAARTALNGLREIDARWNDQLVNARFSSGTPPQALRHGRAYAELEVRALRFPHAGMGLAVGGVKSAFDFKGALMQRVAAQKGGRDAAVDAAWLAPTGPRLDQLSRVLDRAFDDALLQAELYRAWMLYYSAFLLVVLAWLVSELYKANASLERRVAQRTRDLSAAMDKLKESEAMLVQSEKMSSLGQMVAGLAHEVNTPLAYVKASLESVRSRVGEAAGIAQETGRLLELLSSDQADEAALAAQFALVRKLLDATRFDTLEPQLKDGLHGINEISELVANLKDFSRLDRSRMAEYDLHQGIDSTLRIAQRQLGKRVVKKIFCKIPLVSCSPSQINQVLLNLVVNAAHATAEEGGLIGVRTAMRDDARVAIDVSDNGHGIPEDVLPRIFDPFFTTKDAGKGTGLGLSICYKIVESHGGKLEVQSKVGVGTRFTLLLPWRAPASTS